MIEAIEQDTEEARLYEFVIRPGDGSNLQGIDAIKHTLPDMQEERYPTIFSPFVLLLVMLLLPQPISVGVIVSRNYNTAAVALEQPQQQRNSGPRVAVSEQKPKDYSVSTVDNLSASDTVIAARRPKHFSVFNDEHLSTSDSVTGRQSASAR
jgi:hypothetical protein